MPAAIHENFRLQLINLQAKAAAWAAAGLTGAARPWLLPLPNAWSGNVLDIPSIAYAFDRTAINDQYASLFDGGGTVADFAALRAQLDYLAAYERAFRTRHASPIRAEIQAEGRRAGHGNPAGLFQAVIGHVTRIIAAGS